MLKGFHVFCIEDRIDEGVFCLSKSARSHFEFEEYVQSSAVVASKLFKS